MTMQELADRSRIYNDRMAKVNNALDSCGIGHDVGERMAEHSDTAGEFIGKLAAAIMAQAAHDALVNVPTGTLSRSAHTADHAILAGTVHAACAFLHWDCDAVTKFAADCLDDANCHGEAALLRNDLGRMARALKQSTAELRQWHTEHHGDCKGGCPTMLQVDENDAILKAVS